MINLIKMKTMMMPLLRNAGDGDGADDVADKSKQHVIRRTWKSS